jgi:tetratricopeptide (TPR) repeat protein
LQRSIEDYNHGLELDPDYYWTYIRRGYLYLRLQDIKKAQADFQQCWHLNPSYINAGWMVELASMCQVRPDLATADPQDEVGVAYVCRGVAYWLRGNLSQALAELTQATKVHPESEDAYFWKGMICAYLGLDLEALSSIQKSLELDLPQALLVPLQWFKKDKPRFYKRHAISLLAQYNSS